MDTLTIKCLRRHITAKYGSNDGWLISGRGGTDTWNVNCKIMNMNAKKR